MKSVLISIQPKWCELIASGKKTVEVRKTRPKIETPFKVYIYCTHNGSTRNEKDQNIYTDFSGKVIGEFVCDHIEPFTTDYRVDIEQVKRIIKESCVCFMDLSEYENNSICLYAWHISNLVIYDKPRELSEFKKECNGICLNTKKRINCERFLKEGFSCDNIRPIERPPQSWCYVEDLG